MLSLTMRSRDKARAGSSLRRVSRTAVRIVSGSSLSSAARKGAVAFQGLRVACRSHRPMTAFQKPSTLQGAASRKHTSIRPSTSVQPPAPSTWTIAAASPR